jgi:hypothetical protein
VVSFSRPPPSDNPTRRPHPPPLPIYPLPLLGRYLFESLSFRALSGACQENLVRDRSLDVTHFTTRPAAGKSSLKGDLIVEFQLTDLLQLQPGS